MVLGVNFRRTLGPILLDFDDLYVAFWHQCYHVLWKGVGSTHIKIAPTNRLHAMHVVEPVLLDHLLQSFEDVFVALAGLPPTPVITGSTSSQT